jgi:hypothetical protein
MMARGGAAFDGIIKFPAAGTTGALALAGGDGVGHKFVAKVLLVPGQINTGTFVNW